MAVAKVRARGQITLPASMRRDLGIEEDTAVSLVKVGRMILLAPAPLGVDEFARKAEREMKKRGLDLGDLLSELDRERKRYVRERYGA